MLLYLCSSTAQFYLYFATCSLNACSKILIFANCRGGEIQNENRLVSRSHAG